MRAWWTFFIFHHFKRVIRSIDPIFINLRSFQGNNFSDSISRHLQRYEIKNTIAPFKVQRLKLISHLIQRDFDFFIEKKNFFLYF